MKITIEIDTMNDLVKLLNFPLFTSELIKKSEVDLSDNINDPIKPQTKQKDKYEERHEAIIKKENELIDKEFKKCQWANCPEANKRWPKDTMVEFDGILFCSDWCKDQFEKGRGLN